MRRQSVGHIAEYQFSPNGHRYLSDRPVSCFHQCKCNILMEEKQTLYNSASFKFFCWLSKPLSSSVFLNSTSYISLSSHRTQSYRLDIGSDPAMFVHIKPLFDWRTMNSYFLFFDVGLVWCKSNKVVHPRFIHVSVRNIWRFPGILMILIFYLPGKACFAIIIISKSL